MIKLWIIGAGGWGREVVFLVRGMNASEHDWRLHGFLDDRTDILNNFDNQGLAILGDPLKHLVQKDELFVCAQGSPLTREKYSRSIRSQGGKFVTVIPRGMFIPDSVKIEEGCIFSPNVQISPDSHVGSFTNIHSLCILGHDVSIGNYCQIGAMVFLGGGVQIGNMATIHPHATILPGIKIGEEATVGAGAVVIKDVPPGTTVYGNPAKIIFRR